MIFCYLASAVSFAFAVLVFFGRGASYVTGYSMISSPGKSVPRFGALCKNLSVLFLAVAVFFALTGYSETFRLVYFRWGFLALMFACVADVMYISQSKKFVC